VLVATTNPMNKQSIKKCVGQIGGQELCLQSGELAKQADGSVLVQYGDTVVLGTATMGRPLSPDADFLPLLVDYEEKFYAAGKIKGSRYIKREGRPYDEAIVTARMIDRAIRPLFPEGMINDVQVVLTVLSYDGQNDPDIPAMIAAFGALLISGIPWQGPLAAARIGRLDDKFVINPTVDQRQTSTLDLIVAGTGDGITMLECGAHEIPEDVMLDAMAAGQKTLAKVVSLLEDLKAQVGKPQQEPTFMKENKAAMDTVQAKFHSSFADKLEAANTKEEIGQAERDTVAEVMEQLTEQDKETITEQDVRHAVHELHGTITRQQILEAEVRSDGRALNEVRDLYIRTGVLPRTHGSALFQRGGTQILTTVTLGGPADVLFLDTMATEDKKRYIHYYNFPAFSVGEIKPNRGPGRREIGHGALAERALQPVLPRKGEDWPYMMLLVSEVLESHGSSSMASVCGSSLALMDAGVPISQAVAGIAMGLITDGKGNHKIMTDIAGLEDEKGDMDLKVAGTKDGITAFQMDINVSGLTRPILAEALDQAKQARLHILEAMNAVISQPRADLSPYAPRIHTMRISVEKIGDLIGPKGKHINEIIEQTGVDIDIEDDGLVSITTNDAQAMDKAIEWVKNLTREIKAGEKFEGRVTRLMNFGAFVELIPNVEGMVHISQFRDEHIDQIEDVVKVGDIIPVVVIEIDSMGRINLSHKAAVNGQDIHRSHTNNRSANGQPASPRRDEAGPPSTTRRQPEASAGRRPPRQPFQGPRPPGL